MNRKYNRQAGPGKPKSTNSPQPSGAKNKLTFAAPKKKIRKSPLTTWPDPVDSQTMEDLDWRMGL